MSRCPICHRPRTPEGHPGRIEGGACLHAALARVTTERDAYRARAELLEQHLVAALVRVDEMTAALGVTP